MDLQVTPERWQRTLSYHKKSELMLMRRATASV